ncbi:MAG: Ldh family oxidoreductase [Candidatus Levyibacteriota bacterium]
MPTDAAAAPAATPSAGAAAALRVPLGQLGDLVAALLRAAGASDTAAAVTARALVDADRAGIPSHGAMLVPMYVERLRARSVSGASSGRVVSDRGGAIVIDAANALGQVTAQQAVRLLAERAPAHGLAAVAVRNAFHFGAAGYWADALAQAGLVGVAMSNTRPLMPAPGGAERVVGNNPVAIAVPAVGGTTVVFDMATSAGAMGKIRLAAARGSPIPEGWATDARGVPTTDAMEAIAGMLLPAGGAKGFGLAFMIDLLCGALSGGAIGEAVRPLFGNAQEAYGCAQLFIALDVAHFRDPQEFADAVTAAASRVRESAPAPGQARVAVPGDRAARARLANAETCPIAEETARALESLAATLGVANGQLHPRP